MDTSTDKFIIPGGAFSIARKSFESELWRNKPATWSKIWIYILGNVQHEQYKELHRGEGYFNFTELCKMKAFGTDVTINHVEKFLRYARSSGMLQTKKSTHGVVVLVCNYNLYQKLKNYGGERSGIESASTPRLDKESAAEEWAERKRNGSGDINNNDKNDKNAAIEKIKTKKHLTIIGEDYYYDTSSGKKKISNPVKFWERIKDDPTIEAPVSAANDDDIYPNATTKRLQGMEALTRC